MSKSELLTGNDEWDSDMVTPNFKRASNNFPDLEYPCGVYQNTLQQELVNDRLQPLLRAIHPSGNIGEPNSSVKVAAIASDMVKGRRVWKFYRDLTDKERENGTYNRLDDDWYAEPEAPTATKPATKKPATKKPAKAKEATKAPKADEAKKEPEAPTDAKGDDTAGGDK